MFFAPDDSHVLTGYDVGFLHMVHRPMETVWIMRLVLGFSFVSVSIAPIVLTLSQAEIRRETYRVGSLPSPTGHRRKVCVGEKEYVRRDRLGSIGNSKRDDGNFAE